jgi:hypothetical protein
LPGVPRLSDNYIDQARHGWPLARPARLRAAKAAAKTAVSTAVLHICEFMGRPIPCVQPIYTILILSLDSGAYFCVAENNPGKIISKTNKNRLSRY